MLRNLTWFFLGVVAAPMVSPLIDKGIKKTIKYIKEKAQ